MVASDLNLTDNDDEAPMDALRGHSIPYRIALGPQEGRKAFTLKTLPAFTDDGAGAVAKAAGFSLHAGEAAPTDERSKLGSQGQGVALLGALRMQRYAATSPAPPFPPSGCHRRRKVSSTAMDHPRGVPGALQNCREQF